MRGNPFQVTELVNPHPQSDAHFFVELGLRTPGMVTNQEIELSLIAEASENDFRSEAGVARVEMCRTLQKKVGSIATLVDFAEDVEGNLARW